MGLEDTYQEHLLGVANFLETNQSRRFLSLASGSKKQVRKAFQMFYHDLRPKKEVSTLLMGADSFSEIIEAKLMKLGAPTNALILSAEGDVSEKKLTTALSDIVGWEGGTVISCVPGKLAFWESDSMNYRFILSTRGTK